MRWRPVRWVVEQIPLGWPWPEDGELFTSRRAAEQYAAGLARELRQKGYRVKGSARRAGYRAVPRAEVVTDPGRHIVIRRFRGLAWINEHGQVVFS